jgi:hypothetical protein
MNTIEINIKIDGTKESQAALLQYICANLLSEDTCMSSGQIRAMLHDAIDLMN